MVEHCVSCDVPNQNSCNQCATNFVNVVTGTSNQCLCKLPFYVDEQGECVCPPGSVQTGTSECSPCAVSKCLECSSATSTTCSMCADSYELSEDGSACQCPSGMAPLNGQSCAPCADSNCESCGNAALDVCQSCKGNFTIQVKDFNNVTNQVESNSCECLKPFVLTQSGACVCPAGKTYNLGTCQKCAVSNCQNCENSNALCSTCFEPFIINQQGNQCVCKPGFVLEQGSCVACQVSNCLACDSSAVDTCNQCASNFQLISSTHT